MYPLAFLAILIIALIAVAWAPIIAVIVAAILFVIFLGYVSLKPRPDETMEPPAGEPSTRAEGETGRHGGIWGERRGSGTAGRGETG